MKTGVTVYVTGNGVCQFSYTGVHSEISCQSSA